MITGLNHLTLAVSDVARSTSFYTDILGFKLRAVWREGAYMEAVTLWLCLSLDLQARTEPHPDYTHVAFSVDPESFAGVSARVASAALLWKANHSEGASLYFLDPDGHKLELHVGSLTSRLDHCRAQRRAGMVVLDEAADGG